MNGRVSHFEIPADDVSRAQNFYREAFGWGMNPVPEMNYTLVFTVPTDDNGQPTEPGGINGGLMARQEPQRNPVLTIEVDDISQALERVESLGGKVVADKMTVGDMGFAAYFTDTEGNVMGLWENAAG